MTKVFIGRAGRAFLLAMFLSVILTPSFAIGACNTDPDGDGTADYTDVGGVCVPLGTGLSNEPVADIAYTFMAWLFGMIAVIAILAFAVSGLQYMTAAGDEKQVDTAKNAMKYAAIGIAVSLSGYIAITAISTLLSANSMF